MERIDPQVLAKHWRWEKDREGLTEKRAIALMLAQASMIKRPVLEAKGRMLVGFRPDEYGKAFGAAAAKKA